MAFNSVLSVPKDRLVEIELAKMSKPSGARAKKLTERGCTFCPQNKVKGINKIFTKVKGKKLIVFASAPGRQENEEGKHLVGDSGKFFWDELKKVGISRNECDVQSAVRCLDGKTKVKVNDKTYRLSTIVSKQIKGKVDSFDETTQTFVKAAITDWHRSERGDRTLYKVHFNHNDFTRTYGVIATEDHQFLTNKGWVEAQYLNNCFVNIGLSNISSNAYQVALGTLLGDATIRRDGSVLSFSHCEAQKQWMFLKSKVLGIKPTYRIRNKAKSKGTNYYSGSTASLRVYRDLEKAFYPTGIKEVSKQIANSLQPIAIATWFMDDGNCFHGVKNSEGRRTSFGLATCGFDSTSIHNLINALRNYGIKATHRVCRDSIFIGADSAEVFANLVGAYILPSMRYKLGQYAKRAPRFIGANWQWEGLFPYFEKAVVQKTKSKLKKQTLYCLSVKGTQNFLTNTGGVVHNCFPADRVDGSLEQRDPRKEEIFCCSKYSDKAKDKAKAQVYIVLGGMAHAAVLGKEFKKSRKIFWSDTLKAKVYCLAHPNYFLRGQFPQNALKEFRDALKSVASDLGSKNISQYAYIESKKYEKIITVEDGKKAAAIIKKETSNGNRVSVDTEFDTVEGKLLLLSAAFCFKPGHAFGFVLDHPKARKVEGTWLPLKKDVRIALHKIVADIIADCEIKKALHHGSSDVPILEAKGSTKIQGYDYDTEYAEFLADPDGRAYGLNAIGMRRYPQFGDYKTIILPGCIPPDTDLTKHPKLEKMSLDQQYFYIGQKGLMHFSNLSVSKLILRNCADADLTKRIELSTRKKVNLPLLNIYKDAAFILADMEANGPDFDFKHCAKVKALYPPRFERVLKRIRKLAGNKEFKPSSSVQVRALLYGRKKEGGLGIEPPDIAFSRKKKRTKDKDGKLKPLQPGTGKNVLEVLGRKYEIARLITEFRKLGKIISTYITAYEACAKQNDGRLRTKWWLTGTRTGRLSSGGEKGAEKDKNNKVINLQNIHGDQNLQNLCTPDKDWRKVYLALKEAISSICSADKLINVLTSVQAETNKERKKALEGAVYVQIDKIKKQLYSSKQFRKVCKDIVKKYGHINVLLGFDQGQIEVRVMAQVSGDKNLRKDCMSGDIHSKVGHQMTGWAVEKIKKDKKTRTLTKNIHFGILFGLGSNGLMNFILVKDPDSAIDEEEAQRLYDNYFKAYPGVRKFIEKMRKFVEVNGYVENMFGFRRPLSTGAGIEGYDNDDESDQVIEGGAYWGNQSINTPVQGAAHQLMLMAVSVLKRKKKKYAVLGVPTLEIHDYIGWKTPLKNLIEALPLAKELLEKEPLRIVAKEFPDIDWQVPLVVEGKVGFRLGDSVDLEDNKPIHEILCDMFFATFVSETKLRIDLKAVV